MIWKPLELIASWQRRKLRPFQPHSHPASFNTCPVYDRFDLAISFGGPSATISSPLPKDC